MKARFLLLALFLPILFSGCGDEPEAPTITPYNGGASDTRFSQFFNVPSVTEEPDPDGVSLKGTGIAADGAYIMVWFHAPLSQAAKWQQGYVYIVDEETGVIYKDVPVMPKVGPLIGRPSREDQNGYVMLINYAGGIQSGSTVSIVIGNYKREHVTIE